MHTGTTIPDLIRLVDEAEKKVEQNELTPLEQARVSLTRYQEWLGGCFNEPD